MLAKLKEVGEIAVPGGFAGSGDLVRMANLTDMRAEVDVNEADLARVQHGRPGAGDAGRISRSQHYAAQVVKLYPQVDRQKGTAEGRGAASSSPTISLLARHERIASPSSPTGRRRARRHPTSRSPSGPSVAGTRMRSSGSSPTERRSSARSGSVAPRPTGGCGSRAALRGGETIVVEDVALEEGTPIVPRGVG